MIRNLKILLAAAMALAALGALGASGAQAAEFHCAVVPCKVTMKPDEVAGTKTAHHVIIVKNGGETFSTTCNAITGEATLETKTSKELTIGNIQGEGCTFLGLPAVLVSNGCHYVFGSSGTLSFTCPKGKVMEFKGGIECQYNIPPQGPLSGVTYHNVGSQITAEIKISKIALETVGGGCPGGYGSAEGEFTTGNVFLTGATDPGGVMENLWWE